MSDATRELVEGGGAPGGVSLKCVVRTTVRLLTFRLTREEFARLGRPHLAFGLACTWLAGVGRYWDNPRASLSQHLGVGSVLYVTALALLNLEHAVFVVMGGLEPNAGTAGDAAYGVVVLLTLLSVMLFVPLLAAYAIIAVARRDRADDAPRLKDGGPGGYSD